MVSPNFHRNINNSPTLIISVPHGHSYMMAGGAVATTPCNIKKNKSYCFIINFSITELFFIVLIIACKIYM